MSTPTEQSKIGDLDYAITTNFREMRSEVEKVQAVNERTEEKLGSLKHRLDQAEVSLVLFCTHPCTA